MRSIEAAVLSHLGSVCEALSASQGDPQAGCSASSGDTAFVAACKALVGRRVVLEASVGAPFRAEGRRRTAPLLCAEVMAFSASQGESFRL